MKKKYQCVCELKRESQVIGYQLYPLVILDVSFYIVCVCISGSKSQKYRQLERYDMSQDTQSCKVQKMADTSVIN